MPQLSLHWTSPCDIIPTKQSSGFLTLSPGEVPELCDQSRSMIFNPSQKQS
jgi:hypothetical protein